MSKCIEKISHVCSSSHTSSNGLQVFEAKDGGYNGWCFSCGAYVQNPYEDKPTGYKPAVIKKDPEEVAKELWEISQYPIVDVPSRMLKKESLAYFGCRMGVSQVDGETPTILYKPYTKDGVFKAYKSKVLSKDVPKSKRTWSIGDQRDVDLFGWDQASSCGSPRLIITEGEEDAIALWQMIMDGNKGTKFEDFVPAVVSLAHGAQASVRDLSKLSQKINKQFKEIILAFDMDEVGQKWAKQVISQVFGNAKIAQLPANDANACLMEGRVKACIREVLWKSEIPKNTSIKSVKDLAEEARKPPEYGWSYPWEGLTEQTRGIRKGEVITLAAAVKLGKSSVVKQIASNLILKEDVNILMISPEESPARSLQGMAGIIAGEVFIDPNIKFNDQAFEKAIRLLDKKLFILSSYQLLNWESLREDIKYSIIVENCEIVFLDPISNLIAGMSSSEANEFLNNFMPEIAKMALDYNVTFFLTSHLKATENGKGHEEGAKVFLKQLTGGRAIIRSSHLLLGLEGDMSSLDEGVRNMRSLRIMADRNLGATGSISLWWNRNINALEEIKS